MLDKIISYNRVERIRIALRDNVHEAVHERRIDMAKPKDVERRLSD